MPEQQKMSVQSSAPGPESGIVVPGSRLDSAVARWNARANGAYAEFLGLLGTIEADLDNLARLMAQRGSLAPTLAVTGKADSDRSGEAMARIAAMEDGLADFHIELQTVHAQIRRCLGVGDAQSGSIAKLTADGAVTFTESSPSRDLGIEPKTGREARLAAQVDSLQAELQRVKGELSDARARATTAKETPHAAHTEIARLRARVLEMMARESERPAISRGDLSLQYERILSQAHDEEGRRRRMGEILVSAGVISDMQLEAALSEQRTAWNRHLGTVLVDLGYVSEDTVAQALAAQIKVPYVRLIHEVPKPDALALLSRALAHHHTCVPLRIERDVLVVAMSNPMDLVAIDDIELATRRTIKPVVASAGEIKGALKQHYR